LIKQIFNSYPYLLFTTIAVALASLYYLLLILKYSYDVHKYTIIFLLSSGGLLIGVKLFGFSTIIY